MTNEEEIRVRLGFSADAINRGTQAMLDKQKKAALDYVTFWNTAIKQKEDNQTRTEIEAATRRNRARELLRQRELEQEKRHARDMANVEAGYTPDSWKNQQTLNQKYGKYGYRGGKFGNAENTAGMIGGQLASDIEHGESSREIGGEIGSMAMQGAGMTAGAFAARALFRRFGRTIAKGLSKGALKVFAVAGSAFTGYELGEWINDKFINRAAEEAMKQTGESREKVGRRLEQQIQNLVGGGKLTAEQGEYLSGQTGSFTGIQKVQKALSGFSPEDLNKKDAAEMKRLDEEHAKNLERIAHEKMTAQEKLKVSNDAVWEKMLEMDKLEKNSVEYKRQQLELDALKRQAQEDFNAVQKKVQEEQAAADRKKEESARKQADLNDRATNLSRRIGQNQSKISQTGAEYPTIRELARTNSPFAGIAREYLRAQQDQINAREFATDYDYMDESNLRMVHVSREATIRAAQDRENAARGKLERAGVISPELSLERLVGINEALNLKLHNLVYGGAVINTKIKDDDE